MSIDQEPSSRRGSARSVRAEARRRSRFRRALAWTLATLAFFAIAAGGVGLLQGPRLARTDIDVASSTMDAGSRLILYADRPLTNVSKASVSVSPSTPHTVTTDGNAIAIRFDSILDYNTDYEVTITGVRAPGSQPVSNFNYGFSTGEPALFYLQRTDDVDRIVATTSGGEDQHTVFEAERIQQFEAVGDRLVVATIDDADHSRLVSVALDGTDADEIDLPGVGWIHQLLGSPRQHLAGFVFAEDAADGSGIESGLYFVKLNDDAPLVSAEATGSSETRVLQWKFVPFTSTILFRTFTDELMLTDVLTDADPVVLGSAMSIQGFAGSGQMAVVERTEGMALLDLTSGKDLPFPLPTSPVPGRAAEIAPISEDNYIRLYSDYSPESGKLVQSVVFVSQGEARTLFSVADGSSAVLDICASPNGQFVAITESLNPVKTASDLYPVSPMPKNISTRLLDRSTGDEHTRFDGFDLTWCSRVPYE